ncbi:MAG: aryl-sulfate sulfotransferase [Dysgonomonas sp.]
MKTLKYICSVMLIIFLVSSCDDDNGNDNKAEIRSVKATVSQNNALRVNVEVEFTKPVGYQIEYWKTNEPATKRTTQLGSPGSSKASSTLVFLEPETDYKYRIILPSENLISGEYGFKTGNIPLDFPTFTLELDEKGLNIPGYILFEKADVGSGFIIVTTTEGVVVWYEPIERGAKVVNFDAKTNTFTALTGANGLDSDIQLKKYTAEYIQVIDIFGKVVSKIDVRNYYLHHDVRRMPNGDIIAVSFIPKDFDLIAYGGSQKEQVIGDGYMILGIDGKVKKQWDFFNFLDPTKDPNIMNSKNDWIHANSVNYDSKGDIYMTSRDIGALWKIDAKTDDLVYRVGHGGNIDMPSNSLADGLHSAYPIAPDKVMVLDNGKKTGVTRALLYNIDATQKKGDVDLEIVFPQDYASLLGSNAKIIGDDLLIYGSRMSRTVVFTDLKGNVKRTVALSYLIHRAEYIPELVY